MSISESALCSQKERNEIGVETREEARLYFETVSLTIFSFVVPRVIQVI